MTQISAELCSYLIVHRAQVTVTFIGSSGPVVKVLHDASEVLNSIGSCQHGIVAYLLTLQTRIERIAFGTEPKPWILHLIHHPFVQVFFFFFRRIILIETTVAPLYSPVIIIANTRHYATVRNSVFGLRHIIEPGVIHNGGSMTVFLQPVFISEFFYRYRGT